MVAAWRGGRGACACVVCVCGGEGGRQASRVCVSWAELRCCCSTPVQCAESGAVQQWCPYIVFVRPVLWGTRWVGEGWAGRSLQGGGMCGGVLWELSVRHGP